MKLIVRIFSLIYQYATAFVVIGSPLFFIPAANFAPDITYYLIMTLAVAIALFAYIVQAFITKSWHAISRFELFAYGAFSIAVFLSTVFSRDIQATLFGYGINPFTAASLLALPAIMYLVRTLPDTFRDKLKQILVVVLAVASALFIFSFMIQGAFGQALTRVFSGFTSSLSLATYVGLFVLAIGVYLRRSTLHIKHKIPVGLGALVFIVVLVTLGYQGDVRPNISSSATVAREVLVNHGVFGIGAGDYARAWQLYRPSSVIASEYFNVDFNQGSGTLMTFLSTIGVVGTLAFLFLTGGAWVATYRAYKQAQAGKERLILGFLALLLGYFTVLSVIVPLSYAMLVVWMVIAGFGIARLPLDHMYASRKIAYVLVPLATLVLIHTYMTTNKALAMNVYMQAQKELAEKGPTDQAETLLARAVALSPFDGFYRTQVEYAIARERALLSSTELSEEEIRTKYLEKAQYAVDAGLAAVKANPNNYQNYVSLGRAYELAVPFDKTAGYDNAKKSYQEAIRLYPNNPYLYVMLARLEASAGTREGVRVHLGEALSKKQNFADALYLMSQLEVSEERLEEALTYAVEAVKAAPNDPNVYIQAGLLFYAKKDYQNAVAALDRALALQPANANTAYFLALSLRDGGQVDIAKQIGEELLKRNPGNADLETFLASLEAKTGTATSTPRK